MTDGHYDFSHRKSVAARSDVTPPTCILIGPTSIQNAVDMASPEGATLGKGKGERSSVAVSGSCYRFVSGILCDHANGRGSLKQFGVTST